MAGVNKVILVGNLGKDPEIRTLENGRSVANFSLATTESYKNREGTRVEHTEWHNIVMWTPLAEIAQRYLTKGSPVYLEGKLTSRSFDDKEGNKRYITEVVVREMQMLGSRQNNNQQVTGQPAAPKPVAQAPVPVPQPAPVKQETEVDDLPF